MEPTPPPPSPSPSVWVNRLRRPEERKPSDTVLTATDPMFNDALFDSEDDDDFEEEDLDEESIDEDEESTASDEETEQPCVKSGSIRPRKPMESATRSKNGTWSW